LKWMALFYYNASNPLTSLSRSHIKLMNMSNSIKRTAIFAPWCSNLMLYEPSLIKKWGKF